jgi:hypothetical protein
MLTFFYFVPPLLPWKPQLDQYHFLSYQQGVDSIQKSAIWEELEPTTAK